MISSTLVILAIVMIGLVAYWLGKHDGKLEERERIISILNWMWYPHMSSIEKLQALKFIAKVNDDSMEEKSC